MKNKNEQHNARLREMDRRKFIQAGSLLTLGSMLLPAALLGTRRAMAGGDVGGACDPTSDDILGPFYLPGSPNTTVIALPGEPGDRLYISGTVLSNDCLTPVPGAMVEVWQANDAGAYDTSPAFLLRGTMYTDASGYYAFESIIPGAYLNGSQYRPKHIHYKVSAPGFPTLITQLYFECDPYIPADPWASQPDAAMRIIPLNSIGTSEYEGVFDIVLDGFTSIKPNRYGEEGDLLPPYPNPCRERTSIHFNVFRSARAQVVITDVNGGEISTLVDQQMPQGRYTIQWDGTDTSGNDLGNGVFIAHLRLDGKVVKSRRIIRQH